jgi:hypothetical protein
MKQVIVTSIVAGALALAIPHAALDGAARVPKGATAKCSDGTYSMAKSKQGACSAHGGVATWLADEKESGKATKDSNVQRETREPSQPSAKAPKQAGNATAQCNDGTYSYAVHHQGACSGHQGVKTWFN